MTRTKIALTGLFAVLFMVFGTTAFWLITNAVVPAMSGEGDLKPAGTILSGFTSLATVLSFIAGIMTWLHKAQTTIEPYLPPAQKTQLNTVLMTVDTLQTNGAVLVSSHKVLVDAIMAGLNISQGKEAGASGTQDFGDGKLEWSFKFTPTIPVKPGV